MHWHSLAAAPLPSKNVSAFRTRNLTATLGDVVFASLASAESNPFILFHSSTKAKSKALFAAAVCGDAGNLEVVRPKRSRSLPFPAGRRTIAPGARRERAACRCTSGQANSLAADAASPAALLTSWPLAWASLAVRRNELSSSSAAAMAPSQSGLRRGRRLRLRTQPSPKVQSLRRRAELAWRTAALPQPIQRKSELLSRSSGAAGDDRQ